jgi:hypothetical protein
MRRAFWRQSIGVGWRWLLGVTDHAGRALTVAAVLGIPTLALLSFGWWGLAAGVVVALLLALAEGAFQTWHAASDELGSREAEDEIRAKIRGTCSDWVASVETFLDARAAKAPGPRGGLRAQLRAQPLTDEQRNAIESYDRETVSVYIERYRDRGVKLFDLLVDLGTIVPDGRKNVHSPTRPFDIRDAADTVEIATSRL